jgi:hypothetical protein
MASRFETTYRDRVVPAAQRAFGTLVCFCRGVYVSDEFTARRSDRIHSAIGAEFGIEVKVTMRDFVLPVASVLIDGDQIEPRTGDRIIEGDEVFEIQPPDDNTPSVELHAGLFEWLVHTKKIKVTP